MTYFLDTRPHSVGFFKDENIYIKETFICNNYKYLWLSGNTSNWRDHDDKFSLICFLENKIQGIFDDWFAARYLRWWGFSKHHENFMHANKSWFSKKVN